MHYPKILIDYLRSTLPFYVVVFLFVSGFNWNSRTNTDDYIITKKNGNIILAYKAFDDFLDSDKSWECYKSIVLDPFPSLQKVHQRQIEWGLDTVKFREDLKNCKREDYAERFDQYSDQTLHYLYDSILEKSHKILPPVKNKQVDLCFFLPYGGCFVIPEKNLNTIFISMWINPADAEKIMAHEYAHILHIDRRPEEPLTLKREIVSEGMAVFLTTRIIKDIQVSNSVPFMSPSSFEWCMENEEMIKDSVSAELNDTTMRLFQRYISDGSFAEPPAGFVQKTGYFTGYRIIEACINKGIPLEDICTLHSEEVISRSGYFK